MGKPCERHTHTYNHNNIRISWPHFYQKKKGIKSPMVFCWSRARFFIFGSCPKKSIWEWMKTKKKQPVFGHIVTSNHSIGILDICTIFNEKADNNPQLHHDRMIHTIELYSCAKTIWRKYQIFNLLIGNRLGVFGVRCSMFKWAKPLIQ